MQVSVEGVPSQPSEFRLGYLLPYLGKSGISSVGVSHLSKAEWKVLRELYLGSVLLIKAKIILDSMEYTS